MAFLDEKGRETGLVIIKQMWLLYYQAFQKEKSGK